MVAYCIVSLSLAVALYFLTPGAATAGFDDGFAAYQRGDYDTAFRAFMPLAVAGDPTAQLGLGVMYLEGYGVPQDHAEAVRCFRLAANPGVPAAQHALRPCRAASALRLDPPQLSDASTAPAPASPSAKVVIS